MWSTNYLGTKLIPYMRCLRRAAVLNVFARLYVVLSMRHETSSVHIVSSTSPPPFNIFISLQLVDAVEQSLAKCTALAVPPSRLEDTVPELQHVAAAEALERQMEVGVDAINHTHYSFHHIHTLTTYTARSKATTQKGL